MPIDWKIESTADLIRAAKQKIEANQNSVRTKPDPNHCPIWIKGKGGRARQCRKRGSHSLEGFSLCSTHANEFGILAVNLAILRDTEAALQAKDNARRSVPADVLTPRAVEGEGVTAKTSSGQLSKTFFQFYYFPRVPEVRSYPDAARFVSNRVFGYAKPFSFGSSVWSLDSGEYLQAFRFVNPDDSFYIALVKDPATGSEYWKIFAESIDQAARLLRIGGLEKADARFAAIEGLIDRLIAEFGALGDIFGSIGRITEQSATRDLIADVKSTRSHSFALSADVAEFKRKIQDE